MKSKRTSISQCIIIPGLLEQDGRVLCCKPRENTSSCRASGSKTFPFPKDPSVALLTSTWHDCTGIKTHLNGKPTFPSQECAAVTVGTLETLAMLGVSRLQRISVLPRDRLLDAWLQLHFIFLPHELTVVLFWVTAGWIGACSGRLKHGPCLLTLRLEPPSSTCYKIKLSVAFLWKQGKKPHWLGCQSSLLFLAPLSHQQDAECSNRG